jgi:hypothetical protein
MSNQTAPLIISLIATVSFVIAVKKKICLQGFIV